MRALFLLSIPTPLVDLGLSQQIKGALIKLRAALPAEKKEIGNGLHQCLHFDWVGWHHMEEHVPHLQSLQQAVWNNRMLAISYRSIIRDQIVERFIAPYSLVAKAGTWYLVGVIENRTRVLRVSRIVSVTQHAEKFERPATYDLYSFWQNWCKQYEESRSLFRVLARINPELLPYLPNIFGEQVKYSIENQLSSDQDDWITIQLTFESFEVARAQILSCGRAIEIMEPRALRVSVVDYANQIVSFYTSSATPD